MGNCIVLLKSRIYVVMKMSNIDDFIQEATEQMRTRTGEANAIWSVFIDLAQAIKRDMEKKD